LQCTGVAITVNKLVLQPYIVFLEVSHRGVATTGKVLHHIDFILDVFGAGGLYWSLAFLLNLLDNNLLTVSQTTTWESLA
jgi:hypothetical protein